MLSCWGCKQHHYVVRVRSPLRVSAAKTCHPAGNTGEQDGGEPGANEAASGVMLSSIIRSVNSSCRSKSHLTELGKLPRQLLLSRAFNKARSLHKMGSVKGNGGVTIVAAGQHREAVAAAGSEEEAGCDRGTCRSRQENIMRLTGAPSQLGWLHLSFSGCGITGGPWLYDAFTPTSWPRGQP